MLRETTQRMMASVRPYDTVGRYGGEEFLIVVPSSDAMGALGLSERIRRAIEAKPIVADSHSIVITASFGVAASTPARPLDPHEMLHLADDALYRAKDQGRNRSELATPQDLTTTSPVSADAGVPQIVPKIAPS